MNLQTDSLYQQRMPLTKPVQSGKVIPLYPVQSRSLLDDKRTYLILHIAIGAALGASFLMVAIALFVQLWIQRSVISTVITLCGYGAVTYYYHGIKSKKTSLMYRGITIVILSALSILTLVFSL